MELTKYQKDILNFFKKNPQSNMYINAKAGCGKSFIAAKMLENTEERSIYVAFNKSIANEMKEKITNKKVQVSTLHSLCYSILIYNLEQEINQNKKGIGTQRVGNVLDNFKIYNIVNEILYSFSDVRYDIEYKAFLTENYVKMYNLIRLKLVSLESWSEARDNLKLIIKEQGLFFHEEYKEPDINTIYTILRKIDEKSWELFEKEHKIDFTDMLYITLKKLKSKAWEVQGWHYYQNIIIDEGQDLSTIQLVLLKYIKKKTGRYVYILDPKQAIYGFAGANAYSCQMIKRLYAPIKEFELPVNYRCASKHLDYVNENYGIGIQASPNASEGLIKTISKKKAIDLVQAGDFVVGRKNKWLLPIALELIKIGKPVCIKDEILVKDIVNFIEKFKSNDLSDLVRKVENKINKINHKIKNIKIDKISDEEEVVAYSPETTLGEDKVTIVEAEDRSGQLEKYIIIKMLLDTFKDQYTTQSKVQFLKYIKEMLNTVPSDKCINITSIHCVKGLEATNVFVLNEGKVVIDGRMSIEQKTQEYNLSYVALTRAKENLYLVKAEGVEYP